MSCIVLEPKKITFLHIPKTGGTSIRANLVNNYVTKQTPKNDLHITVKKTKKYFGKDLGIKFCVTRNPYDRWASLFYHASRTEEYVWYNDLHYSDLSNHNRSRIKHHFFAFLTNSLKTKWQMNIQWEIAKDCDYVLRYDQLEKDFCVIQDILGNATPLLKKNINPWINDYSFLFKNKRIVELVNKLSDLEFQHLNYDCINNNSI